MRTRLQHVRKSLIPGYAPVCLVLWSMILLGLSRTAGLAAQPRQESESRLAPTGTIIPLQLKNTIDSKGAYENENVYCETIFPVALHNHMLIPAHSYVRGHVTEVDQPGHIVGKAQLSIKMDTLTLPNGETWAIRATVYSLAGTRLSTEKTATNDGDTGGGQTFKSPHSNESVIDSSGLASANSLSAASEGVGGLVLLLVTRGKRIVLRPGTTMEIRLTAPLDLALPPPPAPRQKLPPLKHRPSNNKN